MNRMEKGLRYSTGFFAAAMLAAAFAFSVDAQTPRPTNTPRPGASPTPEYRGPVVVSRAEDQRDDDYRLIPVYPGQQPPVPAATRESDERTIENLENRLRTLESARNDPDARQRRLLLNLEILSRAEQRADALRKQFFELLDKESTIQIRLEAINVEIRPEMIERAVATAGSLRPEELREARRRGLESERTNLQAILTEVQRNKANLEVNLVRADELVERLRARIEIEIDAALEVPPAQPDRPDNY
jgi:hypothetical protein